MHNQLPYDSKISNAKKIPIVKLALIIGKIDLADPLINRHFEKLGLEQESYTDTIHKNILRPKIFIHDLDRLFIQPTLIIFNDYLKNEGITPGYKITLFQESTPPSYKLEFGESKETK